MMGRESARGRGPSAGSHLAGRVSTAWESLPVSPSVPQAPLCLAGQGALPLVLAYRQV